MRVLVLGGNRYIGLHLVFELARQGHQVTIFNSHLAPMPEGARRLHGDRHVPGMIQEVLGPHRDEFDAVYDNTSFQPADVQPLVDLFGGRVKHYVFTSSIAVYLQSDVQPIAEDFPVGDEDANSLYAGYGPAKVLCERLLRAAYERNGFPATCLRVSHSCGPHSPLPTREPGFFARLEAGRPILVPGDGHALHPPRACSGCRARDMPAPVVHWREWMNGGMVFAIDKARRDLGWEPMYGLESGLEDGYRWFRTGGRERYTFDFSQDEAVLARLKV